MLFLAFFAGALPLAPRASAQPDSEWRLLDGLPTTVVTAVLQDNNGFIWIGTHVGLARSDGHNVEVFRPGANDPGSLVNAVVNVGALLEARDGTIWIGTRGGLCRKVLTSTRFDCIGPGSPGTSSFSDSTIAALAEAPDGTIWAGTTGGLHTVDPNTLQVRRVDDEQELPHPYVSALAVAPDGTVWAGTSQGLAVRPVSARSFLSVHGLPSNTFIQSLLVLPTGEVWVGTRGHGLFHIGWPNEPAIAVSLNVSADALSARRGHDHIVALDIDPSGRLWIGTWGGGLFHYDPVTGSTDHFLARPGDPSALPSNEVVDLAIDGDGGVWAATWGGLAYRPPPPPYRLLTHHPEDPTSLSSPRVTRLLPGPSGELWVGTFGGGLNRCDPISFECQRYRHNPNNPASLCHDMVLDLAFDAEGSLWVATSGAGVCRLELQTGLFTPAVSGAPPALQTAHVYALAHDPTGSTWIGTAENGLARTVSSTGTTTFASSLSGSSVYALAYGSENELWVGTLGSGLCRTIDGESFDCLRAETDELADDWVTTLAAAPGGLWAGGISGLDWIPADGQPQHVLSDRDLVRPHVTCVLPTPSGTWVATASGILRLDSRSRLATHDAAVAGLPTRGFLRPACAQLRPNLLAFGTENGVLFFNPDVITAVQPAPTRVTAIRVDGKDVSSETPAHLIRSLTIRPNQSGPSFQFATFNYSAPEARRYVYRLDGIDKEWSRPSTSAEVTYPKLPPGRYTFRVRPALQPLAAEASIELIVLAPIWRRPWFLLLAITFAVTLGVALYRARVAYLLRIERTRQSIADDLHDDIGSRLSGLALALDVAAKTFPEGARAAVRARADEARALLSDLRDTVWVVDGTFDTLAGLADRVQLTAETLLPDAFVTSTTTGNLDRQLSMDVRRHVLFFCKEALHNASRHGNPQTVRISVEAGADHIVTIRIEDDGQGFDTATKTGRGLGSLRRRSEAIGGTFDVTSGRGEGTVVTLSFKL